MYICLSDTLAQHFTVGRVNRTSFLSCREVVINSNFQDLWDSLSQLSLPGLLSQESKGDGRFLSHQGFNTLCWSGVQTSKQNLFFVKLEMLKFFKKRQLVLGLLQTWYLNLLPKSGLFSKSTLINCNSFVVNDYPLLFTNAIPIGGENQGLPFNGCGHIQVRFRTSSPNQW